MKYICVEDIEIMAAQGRKELVLDGNTVVMDLARDMTRQLGITIVDGSRPAPAKAASLVASAPSVRDEAPKRGAKPKGCQHAAVPVVAARPEQPKSQPSSDGVVDQLVELVRQSTGKRSGN